MSQNTVLITSTPTVNIYNISKYSNYSSPQYTQNFYQYVPSGSASYNIQTQYALINLSIDDSVNGNADSIIFLISILIPVLGTSAIKFLGVYNTQTNTIPIQLDKYYGQIVFKSNSTALFEFFASDGSKVFLSTLSKSN
jgi:hypothetical protein